MEKPNLHKRVAALVMALALLPLFGSAQTVRDDVDWDGDFDISDVTALIYYVLHGEWSDAPSDMETETVTVNGESFDMVHVDGGILTKADGAMYVVSDFWICSTEVTQQLWCAVMGGTPNSQRFPKSEVTWTSCQAFIDSLNVLTGRHFRFPTSIEWEFAARGGNRSLGYTYCGGNDLDVVGWYKGNCGGVRVVGQLKCNELGLYDMSGNVCEWCQDSPSNGSRYYCGGSYRQDAASNTASQRGQGPADGWFYGNGFRLAL